MKFKEYLNKYQNGIASQEEKKVVEEELEKYQAIEEYLAESIDLDLPTIEEKSEIQKEETIQLKKSVNSRLRKVVLTSVSAVMVILLGVFFLLSPIIDHLFYNPSKTSVAGQGKDIQFDLSAYTELNHPGFILAGPVQTDSHGFGRHEVYFNLQDRFSQDITSHSFKIRRNQCIDSYSEDYIGRTYFHLSFLSIRNPDTKEYILLSESKEKVIDHIQKLNPIAYTSAYLTFEQDLSMEELHELSMRYQDMNFAWVGIRTSAPEETANDLTGFVPVPNLDTTQYSFAIKDEVLKEKYPAFSLGDWLIDSAETRPVPGGQSVMPKGYETHYKSLLKYMVDREEAVNILEYYNPGKKGYYSSALEYIEEHGVNTFGVLVYATAEDLLELLENESITSIELDQVIPSKRYITQ